MAAWYPLLRGLRASCRLDCRIAALYSRSVPGEPLSENDVVSSSFVNRNPRNLEQMLLAHKHGGFELDKPSCSYWHKLVFESTGQSLSGSVVHIDGRVVLRVSSSEWGIRRQLVSATDRSAAAAVACVLARRCLEAGLLCVQVPSADEQGSSSLRLQAFLDGMKEGGILLTESWSPH
ncbi:large ribosomal subunit protein uL18m isoform X1 [Dermacentor albipictus]|uniref:large ribosomal subunit protein uL18m isoform X1 n=2 Tax=Dermacentor albipictus TaxID=60249 RepID=UPI0031FBBDEA